MRVKNRLDPAHRSGASAGYRDVALNLRLAGPAARRLGLDMHVCELQLLLRSFAQFKVRDGRAPSLRRRACAGRGCARSAPTSLRRGVGRTQNPAERIGAPADRGDVWTDACTCSESGRNEDSHLARGGRAERIGARCGMTRRHAWTGTDKCGLMRGAPGLGRASRGTGDTWTSGTCAGSDGGARARLRPGCAGGRV